jgi:hypothetical protein
MTSGGTRKGAGRKPGSTKPTKKIKLGTRIDSDLVAWLREQDRPIAQLIEEALSGWFKIKKNGA